MTTTPRLTARALGRATLARQLLLRRAETDPGEAVRHLVGLQTQVPPDQYTALFSRLAGSDSEDFSRRVEAREFVRLSLMRCTLRTVTAGDALALRPFADLTAAERTAPAEEGEALLAFHARGDAHTVRWSPWP